MNKKKLAGLLLGTLALGTVFPQANIAAAKERPQTVVMTDGEVMIWIPFCAGTFTRKQAPMALR